MNTAAETATMHATANHAMEGAEADTTHVSASSAYVMKRPTIHREDITYSVQVSERELTMIGTGNNGREYVRVTSTLPGEPY